ncbi:MAG: DUF58 domain-containing protein, partial [Pirellulales bacterium]|nr:DUF58 domain-containing protein [Pirellulales bacterium]
MKYLARFNHTREGWYYLTVFVFVISGASLRRINLLMVIAGMMLGPLLINLISVVRSLRGVRASRKCPRQITAGQPLSVEIELSRAAKPRKWWMLRPKIHRAVVAEDTIRRVAPTSEPRVSHPRVLFTKLAAGQTETLHYLGKIEQRGVYELGPLNVSTSWPFGLVSKALVVPDEHELIVHPRPGRLTRKWYQVMREAHAGTHYTRGQLGRNEGDFYGLRDWREGDSQRWIHWKTSARRGSLFVRQFEQARSQDLILLVDLWRPAQMSRRRSAEIEQAVAFAATIVGDVCSRGGGHLAVATVGTRVESFEGPASTLLLSDLLAHFARIDAGVSPTFDDRVGDSRLAELIKAGLRGVTRRRNVVLISTRSVNRDDLYLSAEGDNPELHAAIGRCLCLS